VEELLAVVEAHLPPAAAPARCSSLTTSNTNREPEVVDVHQIVK
jgi:hypothetical protein